jgi:predicted nucleic acid-binding protein
VIVIDTSVFIDLLNDITTLQVGRLEFLAEEEFIVLGDLILYELLRGARGEGEAVRIRERLSVLPVVAMAGETISVAAARNYRILRRQGFTVRSPIDMLIGTFCIENGHWLLHNDRDFLPMVEHLGLLEA